MWKPWMRLSLGWAGSSSETFLGIVEGHTIDWFLAGSGALAVRGLRVSPRDLDIIVDEAGAQRLGDLLLDYLVEPLSPVHDWFCGWWGRAFLGARVEWVGGVDERADTPLVTDFGPSDRPLRPLAANLGGQEGDEVSTIA